MDKDRVAEILTEIGTLLELKGENPFKTRAYENAARALESLTEPLQKLVAENRLVEIKGIGDRSEEHTSELQSQSNLVCRLLLEKKKTKNINRHKTDHKT